MTTREASASLEKLKNSLFVISFFILCVNCGCSASNGDSGSMNDDQSSMDMMKNDPNIVHGLYVNNKQEYGKDSTDLKDLLNVKKPDINKEASKNANANNKNKDSKGSGAMQKSIADQSVQAALQFGVLVGVTLLVIIMYVLNVWVELLCTAISDKITVKLNRPKPPDIEDLDPAILVGSFKRYK